jgi:hypothetical protein
MSDGMPEPGRCRICGYPLDRKNRTGLCSNKTPACRKAREQLNAEEKPGKFRVTINPGDTFGRWMALEPYSMENRRILVRCACGTERRVFGVVLTNGHSKSCGSCVKALPRLPKQPYVMIGSTFGRLTALDYAMYATDLVPCRCECGNEDEVKVRAAHLRHGKTQSCGCLLRELRIKHGLSGKPLYDIWKGIIGRCTDPGNAAYQNYGGRGITVCDRWRDDVSVFVADLEREIGPRPEGVGKGGRALYSLDRIDNDCGYEPGNIRWSLAVEQVANQRTVAKLTQERDAALRRGDALAMRVAELEAMLAPRKPEAPASTPDDHALFLESDIS